MDLRKQINDAIRPSRKKRPYKSCDHIITWGYKTNNEGDFVYCYEEQITIVLQMLNCPEVEGIFVAELRKIWSYDKIQNTMIREVE